MILEQLPPDVALMVRMDHIKGMVTMMQGYIKEHPQHTEYYESVITHLEAMAEGYDKNLQELYAMGEAQCNTLN